MADKGAHPGVKSLLARFENNQQNTTSPPPRDRSPAGSDSLSKVRASFIAVEGGSPASPVLGLRRISPQSGSPPTPTRIKSFSSEDLDGSVKSNESSAQPTNGLASPLKVAEPEKKEIFSDTESKGKQKAEDTTANKENQPVPKPTTTALGLLTAKPTKTVSKRPSNAHIGKTVSTNKPAAQAPTSKQTQPRTATSTSKPDSEKTSRPTRTAKASTITSAKNEPAKAPAHKPSRASLATTNKAATRTSRATTPAREVTRSAPRASDVRSSSTARPTRVPPSSTTSSLSSAAKLSATSGATSTLSRKPSSLKNATTGTRSRAITPTTSSVRKQTSRTSPGQSGSERSHSRASTTKPVDEGFLARMMRPTASSANKAHEKLEVKSPPRTKATRAPRRVPSRLDNRQTPLAQEKAVPEISSEQEERSENVIPEAQPEEDHSEPAQNIAEQPALDSVEPRAQTPEHIVGVEEPVKEAAVEVPLESAAEPTNVGPEITESVTEQPAVEPVVGSSSGEPVEPVEFAGASVESPTESPEQDLAQSEHIVDETVKSAGDNLETTAAVESDVSETPAVSQNTNSEIASDGPLETEEKPETEQKPAEVDLDLSELTLEDKNGSA